jgi:3-methylcrotonyl-CoA carboxylase alpha subunit
MLRSVLIANRGEIACRIIRTAQHLGIKSVVVYSEADAASLSVQRADEAYAIGPSSASQSYLNIPKVLEVAKKAKVEAVHPGYGFLAENETFADECRKAGFIFIGPSLKNLKQMGSKSEAKAIARHLGIPVIPGYEGDQSQLEKESKRIGYPLMIKAALGGGGKGMRRVDAQDGFQEALNACRREALSSFGNDEILLEKCILSPRHIEVQLFGDTHGNMVHLFERDCSLQRRHQKVIEETPSALASSLKEKLFQAALQLGKAIHYEGAGTVEFLVDKDQNFYFMEMNTRLQVEHPITESITGLDLVEWQFLVASGEKLPLSQEQITSHGHAVELRLYAEDPHQNFKPMSGNIWLKEYPQEARIDTGLHPIDVITPYYDPLIAKLIVKGDNRSDAFHKVKLALEEWKILGLKTNASFLKKLVDDPAVLENRIDVDYIDHHLETLAPSLEIPEEVYVAASLIALLSEPQEPLSPWEDRHQWHIEGYHPRPFEWNCGGKIRTLSLTYGSKEWESLHAHLMDGTLFFRQEKIPFWKQEKTISLIHHGETYTLLPHEPTFIRSPKGINESHLKAPMTGKVVLVMVKEGDAVHKDQPILILEAMKMEHMMTSPIKGKVKKTFYRVGDVVKEGVEVMDIEEEKESSHDPAQPR